jgi:hypothetical protein
MLSYPRETLTTKWFMILRTPTEDENGAEAR